MGRVEESIEKLQVSEDTKVLLNELVERKDKTARLKARNYALAVINIGIVMVLLAWMMKASAVASGNMFRMIGYIGSSKATMFFMLLSVSIFAYSNSVTKEYKKQKLKYDDLREETVKRLYASWKMREDSKLRDEVSALLKDRYDINIRYEK